MQDIERAMLISLGITEDCDAEKPSEETPMLETRLAEAEAKYAVLQQMYDALLDRMLRVS